MAACFRNSIYELQDIYDNTPDAEKPNTELVKFILAYKKIQELPPSNPQSFFNIASYHGAPFRGAGWGNNQWWGGYCHHGNILFPTWHRAYMLEIENALHEQGGLDSTIGFPYWDQTDGRARTEGLPHIITDKEVIIGINETGGDQKIPNPLQSYTLPKSIHDNATPRSQSNYTKPKQYTTVRYPYSGLVGSEKDREATEKHNRYMDKSAEPETTVKFLNKNIIHWFEFDSREMINQGIYGKYIKCLKAPNYTVFSNTTSASEYNQQNEGEQDFQYTVSVESPHNGMHLAIGGIDLPNRQHGLIKGANGDMGENNTPSFDPIFFLHHCFIDKVLWKWQVQHNQTEELIIEKGYEKYPGTNSVDHQGPTPWVQGNVLLTLDTKLEPFKDSQNEYYTSKSVTNIRNLGYTYDRPAQYPLPITGPGVFPPTVPQPQPETGLIPHRLDGDKSPIVSPTIKVSGINRTQWRGSFALVVQAKVKQKDDTEELTLVDVEGVLSRWNIDGCANCQAHLNVLSYLTLPPAFSEQFLAGLEKSRRLDEYIKVSVRHREVDDENEKQTQPIKGLPALSDSEDALSYDRHWSLV